MPIRDFLRENVCSVKEKVDQDSSKITEMLIEDQERTVLFENVNGKKAAGNVFSTRKKVAAAMNIRPDSIVEHILSALESPCDVKEVKNPEFKQNSLKVDLMSLPIPKYYPEDGGRYISSGVIVAEYKGKKNVSFHRMMIMDKDRIAVRLVPRHLFTLYNEAKKDGKELNISICVGLQAEVLLAAAVSTDFGSDELMIASAMMKKGHGKPLEVGKCDNGLLVPSSSDYVFEGKITFETTKEGPFVDITGTYDIVRDQPVIKIEKMWSCKDPIFHLLLPGGNDHFLFMGLPREPVILKTVRQAVPRVKNVRLTEGGCCWLNGVVSIAKNKEGDGVNAILAAFSGHTSMKQVIVVDDDIDIFNDREVEWAMATRMQGDRIIKIPGAAGSSLDPSCDTTTWKVGYDATIPLNRDRKLYEKAKVAVRK
ncbi:3-octaprenyl-4-hydroxybenzoate carboxy-lyase [Candidatus Methanoplasma termitum]|uniref:Anhydromevalonate phosphate decarboxylase n=1 Tax=Candidatus Methanoplasma termitum TaxID=1577791 RepID=A0A0A7LGI0_9ARCH|nr:UbiD family decarboxylase [Candidatus Methanoplasma termitum]AIZ56581.1 3-octaprenyl-4-hydroxybenzoate carboxy-lyase [Candidatus Methanoplasma termitum]MCL2333828.1 UbiD family decarboxylase [Candidatus Methanoplasma sp.]